MPVTRDKSKWVNGVLVFSSTAGDPGVIKQIRKRFTVAQVNAGAELLPALPGVGYRMIECSAISVGGAAGAVTSVDVKGTQAASVVVLALFAQASLTQSTELRAGDTGGTILADGASHAVCDVGTAITVIKAGADITVATSIDILFTFATEG